MFPIYQKGKKRNTKRRPKKSKIDRLDKVFALYVRLRDCMPSGVGKCISCGKIKPFHELDCGHYFGRANMATRFDEDNCNAECQYCNRIKSDHLIYYQDNLIRKIGISRYSALFQKSKGVKKWSEDELEGMIAKYSAEVKRLSKEKGIVVKI